MSKIIPMAAAQQTMSSREIAELTGKEHDNVRRDIKNMAEALSLTFEEKVEPSSGGRPSKIYLLPKRETLILVSGYNLTMRAKIIDRWQELEAAQAAPVQLSRMDLIQLALAAEKDAQAEREQRQLLEAKVETDAPKVAFADQVEAAPGAISLNQAAKILDTGRTRFCAWLRQMGWLTRTNEPYQEKITAGLMDVKIGQWEHPDRGLQRSVTALVTGKGLRRLQKLRSVGNNVSGNA